MWYGGICRETGKFCQYATSNGGYCTMTACINHPSVEIITYPWMVEKPKEESLEVLPGAHAPKDGYCKNYRNETLKENN